jgi:hypothetical protein
VRQFEKKTFYEQNPTNQKKKDREIRTATAAQGRAEGQKKQMPGGSESQREKKPKTQKSQAELQVLVSCTAVTFRSKARQKSYEINAADATAEKH